MIFNCNKILSTEVTNILCKKSECTDNIAIDLSVFFSFVFHQIKLVTFLTLRYIYCAVKVMEELS